ncbi:MAG: DinB family protein [Chitinophagales bacterium]|nr:DinB family protein [Chitinophagales bacterium]
MKDLVQQYNKIQTVKQWYIDSIKDLSETQFQDKKDEKTWSIAEVCYHMYLVENGTIKLINKNLKEQKVNNKSTLENWIKNKLTILVLQLGIKFKAPKIVSEFPSNITQEEIITLFQQNTNDFTSILETLPKTLYDKQIFKHPMAGQFNIQQTLNFSLEHYQHHQTQIKNLLR